MTEARYHPPDKLALTRRDFADLGLLCGPVMVLPVLHGRLEFAWLAHVVIDALRPRAIAVEYPESLRKPILRAVSRLPLLSVVTYKSRSEHGRPVYLPIEPADALVEAVRRAAELEIPVHLVDRDVDRYPAFRDRLPDPLAAERVGAKIYLETALAAAAISQRDPLDDAREQTMAVHLARLCARETSEPERPILLLCGLHHARGVIENLQQHLLQPLDAEVLTPLRRVRRDDAVVHHLSESSSREVPTEVAFVQAAFERARRVQTTPKPAKPTTDEGSIIQLFANPSRQRLAKSTGPGGQPKREANRDERSDTRGASQDLKTGRLGVLLALCRDARTRHHTRTGENLRPGTLFGLLRYACRYALTEGRLGPDLYQLVIAARGFADDSYAHEVWEVATTYPWQTDKPDVTPIDLNLRDIHPNVRTIRFRPRLLQRRKRMMRVIRTRPKEMRPGEWAKRFKPGHGICSYPPEDVALEHYGAFLRKRSIRVLSAQNSRSVPFTSSLHDGIDIRETIRNWHENTIYVHIHQRLKGRAGDVILIFEDEPLPGRGQGKGEDGEPRYPWQMTWQGEHEDEGDMALFATDPYSQIIGPGIGRALYGGFVLHRPPGTMFGVWEDSYYLQYAQTKAEVLLLAALDHTQETFVVFVAPDPPRPALRQLARRMGKKLIYTPLGQLSPVALKRVRIFHVLSDHGARKDATTFIDAP